MSRYSNKMIHGKKNEPEEKWLDTVDDKPFGRSDGTPTNYNLFLLNGVRQGSLVNQRIGSEIVMNYLKIDLALYPTDEYSGTAWQLLAMNARIALVYDRQVNGTTSGPAPDWDEFFESWNYAGTPGTDPWANPNLTNRARFKILWDEKFVLPGIYKDTTNEFKQQYFDDTKRTEVFKRTFTLDCKTIFNQVGDGDLNDISSGGLYLVCQSGDYVGKIHAAPDIDWPTTARAWNIVINARLRYADM